MGFKVLSSYFFIFFFYCFSHQIWDLKFDKNGQDDVSNQGFSHQIWDCYSQKLKDASLIKEMEN